MEEPSRLVIGQAVEGWGRHRGSAVDEVRSWLGLRFSDYSGW
jgi:hypothetical protein